jgi:hypothetical protein
LVGANGGVVVDQIPQPDGSILSYYSDGSSSIGMPTQGIPDPTLAQTLGDVKTAVNVGTAIQSKNATALIGDLMKLTNTSSDYQVSLTAANAAKALINGQPLSAISPYLSAILGSDDPNAVGAAKTMLSVVQSEIKPTTTPTNVATNTPNTTTQTATSDAIQAPDITTQVAQTTTQAATQTQPNVNVATKDPVAVPSIKDALSVPSMGYDSSGKRISVPMTAGTIKPIDLGKIFDTINSSNPSENTTINARSGGSINDLVQLLNARG